MKVARIVLQVEDRNGKERSGEERVKAEMNLVKLVGLFSIYFWFFLCFK